LCRYDEVAERAPKGMIAALLSPFDKDNDLGAANVKSSIKELLAKDRRMSKLLGGGGRNRVGQPLVKHAPTTASRSAADSSASASGAAAPLRKSAVKGSSPSPTQKHGVSFEDPATVSSSTPEPHQPSPGNAGNDANAATRQPQQTGGGADGKPVSVSPGQLHVMSAAALMHLSLERSVSWTTSDVRQLLWSFAAAVKRLGNAAAAAAPRTSGYTFVEKEKLRVEHAALGTACGFLCEAVWSLAVMSPERLVPINGGGRTSCIQLAHSLKAPGFNP
jgi:hypothetical protein